MPGFIDITGQKFHRLTAIQCLGKFRLKSGETKIKYLCECECGNTVVVAGGNLKSGVTKSCGCLNREVSAKHLRDLQHSKPYATRERLYKIWSCMKGRCYNPHNKRYHCYGGRGITVCEEWKNDYFTFKKWAYENGYDENAPKGQCTIDRIDVDGNYEPSNCRWCSLKEQAQNRRKQDFRGTYKYKTYEKVCKQCGNLFVGTGCQNYCSIQCRRKHQHIAYDEKHKKAV